MKKLLVAVCLLLGLIAPLAIHATSAAVDVLNPSGSTGPCNNSSATSKPEVCQDNQTNGKNPIFGPDGILTSVIKILSLAVGVISVVIIVVSGLRLSIAGTDSGAAANARRGVVYSLAGLAVALAAQGIVALVLTKL